MNQLVYTFFNKKYLINDNSYDISKKNIDELLIKYFGPLSKKFDYNKLLDLNDEKEIVLKVSDDIYRFYPRGVGVQSPIYTNIGIAYDGINVTVTYLITNLPNVRGHSKNVGIQKIYLQLSDGNYNVKKITYNEFEFLTD